MTAIHPHTRARPDSAPPRSMETMERRLEGVMIGWDVSPESGAVSRVLPGMSERCRARLTVEISGARATVRLAAYTENTQVPIADVPLASFREPVLPQSAWSHGRRAVHFDAPALLRATLEVPEAGEPVLVYAACPLLRLLGIPPGAEDRPVLLTSRWRGVQGSH